MCETHKMKKEKELQKNEDWSSNREYEDCRSLQKRDLPALGGLYREDDWDSRHQTTGQNRPYRKRHCGYWDFEQSEPSYVDDEEAKESRKDCVYNRSVTPGCGDCNSENVDDGNPNSMTKDDWFTGSPFVTQKVGEYGETNGCVNHQNLNHNPKNSKETGQWTDRRDLNDSAGNFGQPQTQHIDRRNHNYNLEDCKETNFYHRDLSDLDHVPENYYTNGQSVDFPDLSGISERNEFVKYCDGDRNVYQNDKIDPQTKIHAGDQSSFHMENRGSDSLFANCEYKFQNYRGADSLHQRKTSECNGIDRPGMMAPESRGFFPEGPRSQWTRGNQGEHHGGVPRGTSLEKNSWHVEEERRLNGPETWKRNSCFRRTAPGTLRHSEFVQNRRRAQGRNSDRLLRG